jgi:hypothetical protein
MATMDLSDALYATLLVVTCDALLCIGGVLVWRSLVRMRVNGPCQLSLGLLMLAQLVADASALGRHGAAPADWPWLLHTVFCFVFLYMLYHVGVLISACKR